MALKNFEELQNEIQQAIEKKVLKPGRIPTDPEGFILVEGFFNLPIQNELGGGVVLGGNTVPVVSIVGKSTGVMHYFALKALLPHIEI